MKKHNDSDFLFVLGVIFAIALSCSCAYWIATSDLPDWFKFWLLK